MCWKWTTYEQELYAMIWVVGPWEHYLIQQDFILYSDTILLNTLTSIRCWMIFTLNGMSFYKSSSTYSTKTSRKANIVAEALSRKSTLLTILQLNLMDFDHWKGMYATNRIYQPYRTIVCSTMRLRTTTSYKDSILKASNFVFQEPPWGIT